MMTVKLACDFVRLISDYTLLVVTATMHVIRTFRIFVITRKSTCDLLLCRSRPISHKARDPKSAGCRQLMIVSPVIPDVTTILDLKEKRVRI